MRRCRAFVPFALCFLAACGPSPGNDAGAGDSRVDAPSDANDAGDSEAAAIDAVVAVDASDDMIDASTMDARIDDAAFDADAALDTGSIDVAMDTAPVDAGPADTGPRDTGVDAPTGPVHVHIMIDNFCHVSVSPTSATAAVSSRTMFAFHNHSVDYEADVWMSYGGGYLGLATGATWNDPIGHCNTPTVHDEYADISIGGGGSSACPSVRWMIHCQ